MKFTDYLTRESCIMDLRASSKDGAIRELADLLTDQGRIKDEEDFIKHVREREMLGSTGIGNHVAIPHCPTQSVHGVVVAFGRSKQGIDFQSYDGSEVNHIFLMGTNPADLNIYLKLLATLSRLLNDRIFRQEFANASTADDLIAVFKRHEK
ncbi:MAG TPA: PTS sugar transporter subunit IIA [Candidatus Omnitrophota bacterium]|nr:PTS sugar transporter subunit IIA [Candidatus Omnitrophota bacterium]HQJ15691.1 PTS sugar transporter subunit IIA [Candidatus Omnitrophota bacterium]